MHQLKDIPHRFIDAPDVRPGNIVVWRDGTQHVVTRVERKALTVTFTMSDINNVLHLSTATVDDEAPVAIVTPA